VLSALPLVFLLARLLFAAVADRVGWSHVFLLVNWPTTLISTAIYYFALSLPAFFAGRVVEGLRESSYWAAIRTSIFCLSPKREGQQATRNNAVIWLATAAGSAATGVGIAFIGFSSTIIVLMLASTAIGVPAAMLWKEWRKNSKPKSESPLAMFNLRGKGKTFWIVSLTIVFNSLATYPLITLLLPVFMDKQLGYSYLTIGLLFMLYNIIASVTTLLTLKAPLNAKRAAIQSAVALVASILLSVSGLFFPAVLCALAFVRGLSIAFFEYIVAKAVQGSKNISVDIGFLHVPMRLAEFSSVLAAGFVAQTIGFTPIFAATGVFFVAFSFMSLRLLTTNNP
jgi:MFS family permease